MVADAARRRLVANVFSLHLRLAGKAASQLAGEAPVVTRAIFLVVLGIATVGASCTTRIGERRRMLVSPTLELVDSLVLAESDSLFVGDASGFAAPADGTYLVSDKRNATLHQYEADGRHRRSLGRRGEGPGEWSFGPFRIVLGDDSLLLVTDGTSRIEVLSYPSGVPRAKRATQGRWFLAGYQGDRTYFANIDRKKRSVIAATINGSDSSIYGGPYTAAIARSSLVGELLSWMEIAILGGDTIAVASQSSDHIFVGPFPNGPFDSLRVPIAQRRGALPELLSRIDDRNPSTVEQALYRPSYPLALHRLPSSGYLAYVTSDQTLVSSRMTGTIFVSVVDLNNHLACPDAEVVAPSDPLPRIAFRGDTLLVLVQDEDAHGASRTSIRKFLIDASACAWQKADAS